MSREKNSGNLVINYGNLMNELKEKISLIRNNSEHIEYSNENVKYGLKKVEGNVVKNANYQESQNNCKDNCNLNNKNDKNNSKLRDENVLVLSKNVSMQKVQDKNKLSGIIDYESNKDEIGSGKDSKLFPYPICFVSKSLPTPPTDYNLRKINTELNEKENNKSPFSEDIGIGKELTMMLEKRKNNQKTEKDTVKNTNDMPRDSNNILNLVNEYKGKCTKNDEFENITSYYNKSSNNDGIIVNEGISNNNFNIDSNSCIDLSKFERNFIVESQKLSAANKNTSFIIQGSNANSSQGINSENIKTEKSYANNTTLNSAYSINNHLILNGNNIVGRDLNVLKHKNSNSLSRVTSPNSNIYNCENVKNGSDSINNNNNNNTINYYNNVKIQRRRNIFTTRYYIMASKLRVIQ
ncbi:hypothetical protein FG379_001601 [Cryptosporidium bovis]|uniref:uncharacterized protein n=1 Tax=Cryptosporidium bovis TaxID=310047 RepID=UPI00351A2E40|nr:hypothetical protein FG379_001601 [Cryptosporidium bovis]